VQSLLLWGGNAQPLLQLRLGLLFVCGDTGKPS
jgi:hypothetical protein